MMLYFSIMSQLVLEFIFGSVCRINNIQIKSIPQRENTRRKQFIITHYRDGGTRHRIWSIHCTTSRKVAVSIADEVIRFLN
jgi:hypothetical protein